MACFIAALWPVPQNNFLGIFAPRNPILRMTILRYWLTAVNILKSSENIKDKPTNNCLNTTFYSYVLALIFTLAINILAWCLIGGICICFGKKTKWNNTVQMFGQCHCCISMNTCWSDMPISNVSKHGIDTLFAFKITSCRTNQLPVMTCLLKAKVNI